MNLHTVKLAKVLLESCALGLIVLMVLGVVLGWRLCTVLSGSMEPVLPVGSLLVIVPEPNPAPGQILTFSSGNHLITHRAVAQNPDGTLVTKGDANDTQDAQALSAADVQGRVVFCLPFLGYVALMLSSRAGRSVAAVICTALLLLAFSRRGKEKKA